MNDYLKNRADQMLERYLALEKAFIWEPNLSKHFTALVLTQAEKNVSKESLKDAIEVINTSTGVFSTYRGLYRFMLAGLMLTESDSVEGTFSRIVLCEQHLKEAGFKSGTHMPMASYALYKSTGDEDSLTVAKRAYGIYNVLKSNHPWITSSDDYSMAVLLAKSNCYLNRIEEAYTTLNNYGFYKGNELQSLSHILALSNRPIEEVASVCRDMKEKLKANKLNLSATFYASLGIISLIYFEDPKIVEDWIELSLYLNQQKKYKWLGKGMNVLLASALVSDRWIKESEVGRITISISIESLIAAQMAALIAASTASAAAASAAANS